MTARRNQSNAMPGASGGRGDASHSGLLPTLAHSCASMVISWRGLDPELVSRTLGLSPSRVLPEVRLERWTQWDGSTITRRNARPCWCLDSVGSVKPHRDAMVHAAFVVDRIYEACQARNVRFRARVPMTLLVHEVKNDSWPLYTMPVEQLSKLAALRARLVWSRSLAVCARHPRTS